MITNKKPRGVPFQKGADDRRHLSGSKSKAALDFKGEFKRILHEEVNIKKLVRMLIRKAEAGIPWAVAEVLDRGLGKAVQFTDNKFAGEQVNLRILYRNDYIDEKTGLVVHRKVEGDEPYLPISDRAREEFRAADTRRLLEAGKDVERAKDEGQDYVEACKEA